ncbi:MAG: hypothetical protein JWO56_988 [Acidobacteria bacterium]|nr:hypothetical protein [Acidobacteriota bacterium]
MSSKKPVEILDFEAALQATPEDIAALADARERNVMTPQEYLDFLLAFAPKHRPDRSTHNSEEQVFEL